jgi:hypothetical protein
MRIFLALLVFMLPLAAQEYPSPPPPLLPITSEWRIGYIDRTGRT